MRFRRAIIAIAALTAWSAHTVVADAATGQATTSGGQTLTVTIDSPADGSDIARYPGIALTGTAAVTGAVAGGEPATVDHVEVRHNDFGSVDWVIPDSGGNWSSTVFDGTYTYTATAIASDGTTATASVRFRVASVTRLRADPILAFDASGGPPPHLVATLSLNPIDASGFFAGRTIEFYAAGLKVCQATTEQRGHFMGVARCSDPAAVALATAARGYTAVYRGDDDWLGSTSDLAPIQDLVSP